MSFCDIISYWRCPKCQHKNRYDLTWQIYYKFKEVENVDYSDETCENCGTSFWVGKSEPQAECFPSMRKPGASRCKNDWIKNLVLSKDLHLTIKSSYVTD